MSLHTEWISYGEGGIYSGYTARLTAIKEPVPSIIVIQEIWGVDEHIQDVTRRLAQAGYAAFAPDLFMRNGTRPPALEFERIEMAKQFMNSVPPTAWRNPDEQKVALSVYPESQQSDIKESLNQIFNLAASFQDNLKQLIATSVFLRDSYAYSLNQGTASVGFCMGGALSGALAAKDDQLSGAVIFYGNSPAPEMIESIQCPVLGFYGETDKRISDTIPQFAESMQTAGKAFEYHIYPNAPHAFFNDTRSSYHAVSARHSFARMLGFLEKVLMDK